MKEQLERTAAPPSDVSERYHSLDFLRGALMMLGIAFHAALPYDDLSPWVKDAPPSSVLGVLALTSHAFRMPLFFIMAGFFAALMLGRRSRLSFTTNRILRIGVPFVAGWVLLTPLISAGGVFSTLASFGTLEKSFEYTWEAMKNGDFFFLDATMHLWFLHYLLIYYGVLLTTLIVVGDRFGPVREPVRRSFVTLLESRWRLPIIGVGAFALLHLLSFPNYETSETFTPGLQYLAFYGAFFAFGFLLFHARSALASFQSGAWFNLAVAAAGVGLLRLAIGEWAGSESSNAAWALAGRTGNALIIGGLLFSSIGLLQRYLNRPLPVMRYIADASYWCYLIHLPLVIWLPGLLMKEGWAPEVKFTIVIVVVTTICVLTYDLLVRWTYLGTLLQGRRYPPLIRLVRRRGGRSVPTMAPLDRPTADTRQTG